jgi:transcription elongation factor Elf1
MDRILECLHCASSDVEVIAIEMDRPMLAVCCKECGTRGPTDPAHAVFA